MNSVSSFFRLAYAALVLAPAAIAFRAKKPDAGIRLGDALKKLGPAYIKLGQMLATRPDIVGEKVATSLEHLQDRLPPFPDDQARAEIARAFGKPVEALFSSFGAALAAASIAQVHRAQTSDEPPVRVAVKILRPGVRVRFLRDLDALAFFAINAERVSPEARRLRFTALVATLADSVALELDLRMEAAAAGELYESTRGEPEFRVPHIDWTRTAESVLTSEWIDGVSVRDIAAITAGGRDPKQVAVLVMRSFLTQALRDGFFHADMHPGNLFIDAEGRLVAVDFGIMGRLDAGMRRFMAGTLAGFLQRDYRKVAELHYEFGFVPPHHPIETFAQALRAVGEPIFGRTARDVSIARLLGQLFETTRRFDMQAQPQLILLQKTMVVVEGVCRGLDPDFDIWEAARPVAEKWVHENMGPEAAFTRAGETFSALGRLAQDLPQLVKNAEGLSQMVSEGGVRLHPDTAIQIAAEQERRSRPTRIALIGVLTLIVTALLLHWHGTF
ncbi:MAG: 2-polyprenylphenol 6-hydroxylase [Alphaproteobacteria bacterium]|nr:2-polyprenylphenol 6-hydroxylase [Alphaproteobacteria bacterium]